MMKTNSELLVFLSCHHDAFWDGKREMIEKKEKIKFKKKKRIETNQCVAFLRDG